MNPVLGVFLILLGLTVFVCDVMACASLLEAHWENKKCHWWVYVLAAPIGIPLGVILGPVLGLGWIINNRGMKE